MSDFLNKAIEFDSQKDLKSASIYYELAVKEPNANITIYYDLQMVYFGCLDPGFHLAHNLSSEFLDKALSRIEQIITEVENKIKIMSYEARFWFEYTQYQVLGEEFDFDFWTKALDQDLICVPIILYSTEEIQEKYLRQREKLLLSLEMNNTERSRYIKSMLT